MGYELLYRTDYQTSFHPPHPHSPHHSQDYNFTLNLSKSSHLSDNSACNGARTMAPGQAMINLSPRFVRTVLNPKLTPN